MKIYAGIFAMVVQFNLLTDPLNWRISLYTGLVLLGFYVLGLRMPEGN
jgi:hypothetical protein